MNDQQRLEALLAAAEKIDVTIRQEHLAGHGGGLCVIKGQRVLFVDLALDVQARYELTVAAMSGVAELENVFLPPEVRDDLDLAAGDTTQ